MELELNSRGIRTVREAPFRVWYKGVELDRPRKVDLLVENELCLELKTLPVMGESQFNQLMSYLRLSNRRLGYLMNFAAPAFTVSKCTDISYMDKGIYRIVNFDVPE